MRYAENWSKVNIEHLNLEKVLLWCSINLQGKQFVEGNILKFDNDKDAEKFKLKYKE